MLLAIFLSLGTTFAQLEELQSSNLGATLLETIQLHMKSNEPIENLVDLMNGIHDSIIKQQKNANRNYSQSYDACIHNLRQQKELIDQLHNNKMELKEEIQLVKPRIEQLEIIKVIKAKELMLLDEQKQIANSRLQAQRETYDKETRKLNEQRYDYVSFKQNEFIKKCRIPLPVKADLPLMKPVRSKLVDFVNEMLDFEQRALDAKQKAYEMAMAQIHDQWDKILELQLDDEIDGLRRKLFGLEIDLDEVHKKIENKQSQAFDINQECQEILQTHKATMLYLDEQLSVVGTVADMIERNYGWLRQQLGL